MKRSARALGFDHLDATVGLTQITCTFHRGEYFRTVIARQHSPAVDASRIEALEDLTHNRLYAGITAQELAAMLDVIEFGVKKRWSGLVLSFAAAIACAAFAYLNFFPLEAVGLVALAAFAGQFVRYTVLHRHVHQIGGSNCWWRNGKYRFLPFNGIFWCDRLSGIRVNCPRAW